MVFNQEVTLLRSLNTCMKSRNRDICDSNLTVMASSYPYCIHAGHIDDMNDFDVLLGNAFKDQIVIGWLVKLKQIDYLIFFDWRFYSIWKSYLT